MATYFNRVAVDIASLGQGAVAFGAALSGAFLTPAEAGAVNGDTPTYVLEEGDDFELGVGVVGGAVTTMTRTVTISKIAGVVSTAKMTLLGSARLRFTESASQLAAFAALLPISGNTTPELRFGGLSTGITYSSQTIQYVKMGPIVNFALRFVLTSKGSATGMADIETNLPYVPAMRAPLIVNPNPLVASVDYVLAAQLQAGASLISLQRFDQTNGDLENQTDVHWANNSVLNLEGIFSV